MQSKGRHRNWPDRHVQTLVAGRQLAQDHCASDFNQRQFKGPGTLTLTVHDASGKRRMTETMEGKGLTGRDADQGKKPDAKVSFDMNLSCGVK